MFFYKHKHFFTPKVGLTSKFFAKFYAPLFSHGEHEDEVKWKKELWYATADRETPDPNRIYDGLHMGGFISRNRYRQIIVTEVGRGLSLLAIVGMLALVVIRVLFNLI